MVAAYKNKNKIKKKSKVGYSPGNESDQIKHANLEYLIFLLSETKKYIKYVEFHSGQGIFYKYLSPLVKDNFYEGSSIRVLKLFNKLEINHQSFLHEKDKNLRKSLKRNIKKLNFSNVNVDFNWKNYVKANKHLEDNENSLFLFDPTYLEDFEGENGLLQYLPSILQTGASLFIYAPQKTGINFKSKIDDNQKIIDQIRNTISRTNRKSVDLRHYGQTGAFERIDHNIIVSEENILEKIIVNHNQLPLIKKDNLKIKYIK